MNTIKNTPLALVTFASRGIGLAIAETLAGAGYDLVLTCSRTLPELSGLANSLEEKYGIHCTAQMADASDPVAMDQLFASLDHLDVLVDCPFIAAQKNLSLRFRGSSNQRLIDMPKTLAAGTVVLWDERQ